MKFEIGPWLSHSLNIISIIILIAFALYITESLWCMLGLFFIPGLTTSSDEE